MSNVGDLCVILRLITDVVHLQGRCNMFHAILLFLVHIKVKEHGMLG